MAQTLSNIAYPNLITSPAGTSPQQEPGTRPLGGEWAVRDGFDLIWRQTFLQDQMRGIEEDIAAIEENANLSDTEKMFSMQQAMNTWSAVTNLRTNMLKSVSDSLKTIVRNVA
jgi:type III secretion apparatus needle protein